jgi:tripeptide aminopeptidase
MPRVSPECPNVNAEAAEALVTEMMAIPGSSGDEEAIRDFIVDRLRRAGLPASAIVVDSANKKTGGRTGNLIAKVPGTKRAPRRLLMAHIDTVPICVGSQPVRDGGFIHSADPHTGLGGDNRAGAAVVLNTARHVLEADLPRPPLTLFWPVQEEVGLLGARHVVRRHLGNPKLCFNWDGGAPHVAVIGATGAIYMDVEVHGIASHAGAHPEDGVSASSITGLAIAELVRDGWHGRVEKGRRLGTSNIGIVSGGSATNVVMNRLDLRAEARSHNPAFRKRIVAAYERAFRNAQKQVANVAGQRGRIVFQSEAKYESFQLAKSEPCVQAALAAVRAAGLEPGTRIVDGGLDANWMTVHGYPTVTLGCGQADIHTVNENLHVASFLEACRIGLRLALGCH